ncbi:MULTISPECIES: MFS transporter [unclassified Micromonospora]|uniref:MFS transporter n=1 Tax=unclassified Micromonospora TaxID=2617518 RepID=UPI0033261390
MTGPRTMRLFTVFVAGYSVSTFGNFLNLVALNLYAYHLTDSALQTGLLMAVRLTAGFLVSPVAGGLVTRVDRRTVMIATDVAQALAMIALLAVPAAGHPQLLYVVAVILGSGNTVFNVALRTSVPELVGDEDRLRGNGYLLTGRSAATVLGFASAGPIIGEFGFLPAFAVNAGSFLVSAVVLACLPLPFRHAGAASTARGSGSGPVGLGALRLLLAGSPVLAGMVALRGVDAWGSASHNVALPVFAHVANPGNPAALLSQFWAAWAVGTLLTHQMVSMWLKRTGRSPDERTFAVAACVMSLAFVAAFTGPPVPLLIAVALVAGFADGCTELAYSTRLQAAPAQLRGYLFGISATAETFGFAVGMLASGLVLERTSPMPVVALFHGTVIATAGVFLSLTLTRWRTAGRSAPRPADRTEGDRKADLGVLAVSSRASGDDRLTG